MDMFNHHEIQGNVPHTDRNRPPQLNPTICGCRCGRGSGGVQESNSGNKDDDSASTLIGTDRSEFGETFPAGPHQTGQIAASLAAIRGIDMMERFINEEGPRHAFDSAGYVDDGTANSMKNEPGSDDRSVAAFSEGLPSRCMSPGLAVAGVGSWTPDFPSQYGLQKENHFVVRPLRLTPHHQCCRGFFPAHLYEDHFGDGDDRHLDDGSGS